MYWYLIKLIACTAHLWGHYPLVLPLGVTHRCDPLMATPRCTMHAINPAYLAIFCTVLPRAGVKHPNGER